MTRRPVGRELSKRHVFDACGVLIVDDNDIAARLFGADGDIGNQQAFIGRRAWHAHARKHTRREHLTRIRKHGAPADRAGRAFNDIVDESPCGLHDRSRSRR
jgi:hypothetical protein